MFNFAVMEGKQKRKTRGIAGRSVDYLLFFGYFSGRLKCGELTWEQIAAEAIGHYGLTGLYETESLVREMRRMTAQYFTEGI